MIVAPADSRPIEPPLDPPLGGNGVSEEKGDGSSTGTNEEEPTKSKEDCDGIYNVLGHVGTTSKR